MKMIPRPSAKDFKIGSIDAGLFAFWDDDDLRHTVRGRLIDRSEQRRVVGGMLATSPFLARIMRRHADWVRRSLEDDADARLTGMVDGIAESGRALGFDDAIATLRRQRNEIALHIAMMDCLARWTLGEVMSALTAAADAAVTAALEICLRRQVDAGRWQATKVPLAADSGITIIAMGKHGAGELNYSSDIDLIVLFEPDMVPVVGRSRPLDVVVRIIQDIVTLLDQQTADGHVFRVDLRLRPDPASNPIAIPLASAFSYYETLGQNWERAALIKARPVAGDLAIGVQFLSELAPFIWRKYFDYAAIADVHAMKRQIHAHKGHEVVAVEGHDIKLGRGGIREIEFFVQTQQLIYGGRRANLRGSRTLAMLDALCDDGWIDAAAVRDLRAAYIFLRMIEHRLQMIDDEQTQRLPAESRDLDRFAAFCGYRPAAFREALLGHCHRVEAYYARLFEEADNLDSKLGDLVFTGSDDDPATLQTLRRMGFMFPERAAETIRGWHFGRRQAIRSARARETLTEIVPSILQALSASGDPDGGLAAFDDALSRMPAATELFALLRKNKALLDLFAQLLGSAPRLAAVIAKRPHVLDFLLDPDFVRAPDGRAVETRIATILGHATEFETFLDQARELAHAERFIVGARVVSRLIDPIDAGPAHTVIAEALLRLAVARVGDAVAERYGILPGGRLAVLAFGKCGGREMTAASDLDLVVVFDAPEGAVSDGDRPLTATDYYARLTQRLISALSTETARGTLYEIDLRLRPSGRKGPVATSLAGFVAYQQQEAETWEHMALTRARAVAGDRSFCIEIETMVTTILRRPKSRPQLTKDIVAMRRLVAREKGDRDRWDLKQARGGLLDIEFTTQFLMLAHARSNEASWSTNTGEALRQLIEAGWLETGAGSVLVDAWRFYTGLTQRLRISLNEAFEPATANEGFARSLANSLGLPDFPTLEGQLMDTQKAVRASMNAQFAVTI